MATGPSSLTPFQASYHWRNKNCFPWSSEWMKKELPGLSIEQDGASCEIVEVTEVEGDVDLGQRKGKLLTIYDCRVVMSWTGKTKEGEEVKGTVTIPEVSHECIDGISDYVYDWTPTPTTSTQSFSTFIRKSFPPIISSKLNTFPLALIAAHGHDITPTSGSSTPVSSTPGGYSPAPPGETRAPAAQKKEEKKLTGGNTSTVKVQAKLQASGEDIWGLLTDEKRIPMWARSSAKMSLTPEAPFELFGGGVVGKIISSNPPKKLVQAWQLRSPTWPSDHFGTLTIELDQGSDSTDVSWTLEGVPKGQEDTLQNALDTYYIRGLKQMGLVHSSSSRTLSPQSTSTTKPKPSTLTKRPPPGKRRKAPTEKPSSSGVDPQTIGLGVVVVGLVAVLVGIVWGSYPSS